MKYCKKCEQELPEEEFYTTKSKNGKGYLHSYCKACLKAYVRDLKREKRALAKQWPNQVSDNSSDQTQ